jgi:DNA-3-methyladenine glycosylase
MRVGFDVLPREFFDRPSLQVAPDLLGCVLWHQTQDGLVAALLTEVEAYDGLSDPASHAYRGKTARNAVMFGPAGHAYVYFTYGMHFCVNLVCQPSGQPSAVLLRAGRIIEGSELATARRSGNRERDLARGPGRLCQALAIDRTQDGSDVCGGSPLGVAPWPDGAAAPPSAISTGPRVGISQAREWPWRFWLTGDRYVTAYKEARPRATRSKPVTAATTEDGTI